MSNTILHFLLLLLPLVVSGDRGCDPFLFKYILVAAISANSPYIFPETDKSSLRGNMELNLFRNSLLSIDHRL